MRCFRKRLLYETHAATPLRLETNGEAKMASEAYKGHRVGSNAGKIHKALDKDGPEAAKKMGEKLGLEPHTVRSMLSRWLRGEVPGKPAKAKKAKGKKASAKKSASKSAPKSAKKAKAKKSAKVTARERLSESATA